MLTGAARVLRRQLWLIATCGLQAACVLPQVSLRNEMGGADGADGRAVSSAPDAVSSDEGARAMEMATVPSVHNAAGEERGGTNAEASDVTEGAGGAGADTSAGASASGGGHVAGGGDPCLVNNGGCDLMPRAVCAAHDGVATSCSCPGGYQGDGRGDNGCVDLDECATENGGCDTSPQAKCFNHVGAAPSCICPSGSMGDGVGADGCVPVSTAEPAGTTACGKYTCDEQTVKDPETVLTWQRVLPSTYDGCSGATCSWDDARAYCSRLAIASGGWRMPTFDELASIVDKTRTNPSIDVVAFPRTPSGCFWTLNEGGLGRSFVVSFL
jgi:hypothetical protein